MTEDRTISQDPPTWDPSLLYRGYDDPRLQEDLARLQSDSERIVADAGGRMAHMDRDRLADVVLRWRMLVDLAYRIDTYGFITWAGNIDDDDVNRRYSHLGRLVGDAFERLDTIERELASVDQRYFDDGPALAPIRTIVEHQRVRQAHALSADGERVFAALDPFASREWKRLHSLLRSQQSGTIDDRPVRDHEVLTLRKHPDRTMRAKARSAQIAMMSTQTDLQAFVLNAIVGEHAATCKLRAYDHWLSPSAMNNEMHGPELITMAQAMEPSMTAYGRIRAQRARLLALDRTHDHDLLAPLLFDGKGLGWPLVREVIERSWTNIHHQLGAYVEKVFNEGGVDATSSSSKYPLSVVTSSASVGPVYISVRFDGSLGRSRSMAHEFGHAVRNRIARAWGEPLLKVTEQLDEAYAVFSEMLFFDELARHVADDKAEHLRLIRLENISENLLGSAANLLLQNDIHSHFAEHGGLSVDDLNVYWTRYYDRLWGDHIVRTPGYEVGWVNETSMYDHVGYVFSYVLGQLVALEWWRLLHQDREGFARTFLDVTAKARTISFAEALDAFGIVLDGAHSLATACATLEQEIDAFIQRRT